MSKNAGDGVTSSSRNSSMISLDRADLDAVGRTPAEQGQVVAHGLGQEAAVSVVADRDVVAALRQLLALLVHEQRQVGERRPWS